MTLKPEWQWLIDHIGEPIPCAICKTPTLAAELREVTVPGAIIFDGTVVVDSIQWVCQECPG